MEVQTLEQFKDNVKKNYLVVSRIDPKTRQELIDFANMDFCGDYGQAIHHIWEQFKEYQFMKTQMFGDINPKLNYIIQLLENKDGKKSSEEKKEIKLLSGKSIIKKEVQTE